MDRIRQFLHRAYDGDMGTFLAGHHPLCVPCHSATAPRLNGIRFPLFMDPPYDRWPLSSDAAAATIQAADVMIGHSLPVLPNHSPGTEQRMAATATVRIILLSKTSELIMHFLPDVRANLSQRCRVGNSHRWPNHSCRTMLRQLRTAQPVPFSSFFDVRACK